MPADVRRRSNDKNLAQRRLVKYRIGCELVFVDDGCSLPEQESLPQQVTQSRRMAGWIAVFLGLSSQSLYLLFSGWTYFHPEDRIGQLWFTAGGWCSILAFVVALFGKKLKRYADRKSVV